MDQLNQEIQLLAREASTEAIANRRHLHRHPELSFQEKETAAFISGKLTSYGIAHQTQVAGHGVVALIEGLKPDEDCIALRADTDALPIFETNSHDYCSVNPGVMHACGHDAHTAILLAVAKLLHQLRHRFHGSVKLLFQPAEEKLPGGALAMIEAGVLTNPKVKAIVGLHVFPTLEVGKVGFREGPYMASADEINIKVKGKGGHAAMPDQINDTVVAAAQTVVNLQQISSRNAPPLIPTVLSFGRFMAQGAYNIIPSEVLIQGTFRTFDETWRERAHKLIESIAQHTAAAAGCAAEVFIEKGYPVLINEAATTQKAQDAANGFLGSKNVVRLDQRMTAEDFAWYSHQVPACFFRLGTGNSTKGIDANLHTPTFDIDESSLEIGIGTMTAIALQLLKKL